MFIKNYIQASIETKQKILVDKNVIQTIQQAANIIIKAYENEQETTAELKTETQEQAKI